MSGQLWITGAAGFSGRHLIQYLRGLSDRPHITGIDVTAGAIEGVDEWCRVDLLDPDAIADAAASHPPTWVIHLAGMMPPAEEGAMWRVNVGGTACLLQALGRACGPGLRFVSIGSAAEYLPAEGMLSEDSPVGGSSTYGRTKWAQTQLTMALAHDLDIAAMAARPFNLIGPGLPNRLVAGALCEQFARRPPPDTIHVGNVKSARDFIDIRDAVAAYWLIAKGGCPGEVYNVCRGEAETIETMLALLTEITGQSPSIEVDPRRLRPDDIAVSYGDRSRIEAAVGWRPHIDLRQSLADMIKEQMRRG